MRIEYIYRLNLIHTAYFQTVQVTILVSRKNQAKIFFLLPRFNYQPVGSKTMSYKLKTLGLWVCEIGLKIYLKKFKKMCGTHR